MRISRWVTYIKVTMPFIRVIKLLTQSLDPPSASKQRQTCLLCLNRDVFVAFDMADA